MNVRTPRLRGPLCGLAIASMTLRGVPAMALDKVTCVQAAEAGQRLRGRGQLVAAREQLLVCASPDCPAVVSQDCTGWLGEAQRSLASVIINARDATGQPMTDVGVSIDGTVRPERAPTAAIDLDPGEHTFRCSRAGFVESVERATLAEGERGREIVCHLAAVEAPSPELGPRAAPPAAVRDTPPAPDRGRSLPWVVWPLGGLGVAALGGFAALGLSGKSDESALYATGCAPNCRQEQVNPIALKFAVADVSLAVGIAALGAATLIGLLHSSSPPPPQPSRASGR